MHLGRKCVNATKRVLNDNNILSFLLNIFSNRRLFLVLSRWVTHYCSVEDLKLLNCFSTAKTFPQKNYIVASYISCTNDCMNFVIFMCACI